MPKILSLCEKLDDVHALLVDMLPLPSNNSLLCCTGSYLMESLAIHRAGLVLFYLEVAGNFVVLLLF